MNVFNDRCMRSSLVNNNASYRRDHCYVFTVCSYHNDHHSSVSLSTKSKVTTYWMEIFGKLEIV